MAKYKIIPSSRTIVQSPISIGHKAEKGVEAIEFDVTAWVETYGSGTLTVIMRRWGDAIPYPIALEIDENNKATWVLSDTDTAKAGMAYAQLSYIVGDEVVKKSDIYTFRVTDSLTGDGEPPEAYESWLETLTHLAAEAMAEVLDIEGVVTDKTLTVDGGIADAKATGEALAEKVDAADYSALSDRVGRNTITLAEKADQATTYTKAQVDTLIESVDVETDTTLSVSGKPADAAETGRQFGLIKADLANVVKLENTGLNEPLVQGAVGSGGIFERNTNRICTKEYTDVSAFETLKYTVTSGYRLLIAFYSEPSENAFVSSKYWLTGTDVIAIEGQYIRVAYASIGDTTPLTVEDADKVTVTFEYSLETAVKRNGENIDDAQHLNYSKAILKFSGNRTIDSTGKNVYQVGRIATVDFNDISDKTGIVYSVASGYRILIAFYSDANEESFVGAKYWLVGDGIIQKQGNYYRTTYASIGDATAVTVADANKVTILYSYELLDKIATFGYIPISIKNNLISDGMEYLPKTKAIKNGIASDANYGQDNVKYQIELPEHNRLHICFDYMYTKNVPYVASGYIDIFGYSNVLHGSERHLGMGQFGILSRRISGVYGRGSAVEQVVFGYSHMQRMGNPAFAVKYNGAYTSANVIKFTVSQGTLTLTKDDTTLANINYLATDTIQSLIDKLNNITDITCQAINTDGTCEDLLLIDGGIISLKPEAIISLGHDQTLHTFEVVIDREAKTYDMSFDGVTLSGEFANPTDNIITIGGDFNGSTTPIRIRNLTIDVNSYGDAEVINAPVSANATDNTVQLISGRNPRLLIFEGHGVVVGSDAYAQTLTSDEDKMAVSTDRLDTVFTRVKATGYVPVKWSDVIAWKQGKTSLPKRCFAIMMDDYRVENYVDYDKRRPFVKHGIDAGLAIVSDTHALTDVMTINGEQYTVAEMFKMIELAGWYMCSHTRNHRRNGDYTASQLIDEFKADVLSCNKHGIYSDVLVYPYGSTGYDATSAMVLSDFAMGVDIDNGGTFYNCKGINTYKMLRTEIGTRIALVKVLAPFV